MIQIFEFVFCMNKQNNPLLSCVPTADDLADTNLSSLSCIKVIAETLQDAIKYVKMAKADKDIIVVGVKGASGYMGLIAQIFNRRTTAGCVWRALCHGRILKKSTFII